MISGKTIFISALDWGLGHATRCVPIIKKLERDNEIIIGTTPLTNTIFDKEFPGLEKINVPAYNISYSSVLPLWLKLVADWPRINGIIKKENTFLDELLNKKKIDVVISDSRFGLCSKKVHCVFITHQLFLKTPFANSMAQQLNRKFILNFNEVWVPDHEPEAGSLSGSLSHGRPYHRNVKYIGPQSRLLKTSAEKKYDYLFLLSGPEPHQGILKDLLLRKAIRYPHLAFALVVPSATITAADNTSIYAGSSPKLLSQLIISSHTVICRSGYSTLMDLYHLEKKNVILVPTPGQTEQEYLAEYWNKKYGTRTIQQKNISRLDLDTGTA